MKVCDVNWQRINSGFLLFTLADNLFIDLHFPSPGHPHKLLCKNARLDSSAYSSIRQELVLLINTGELLSMGTQGPRAWLMTNPGNPLIHDHLWWTVLLIVLYLHAFHSLFHHLCDRPRRGKMIFWLKGTNRTFTFFFFAAKYCSDIELFDSTGSFSLVLSYLMSHDPRISWVDRVIYKLSNP